LQGRRRKIRRLKKDCSFFFFLFLFYLFDLLLLFILKILSIYVFLGFLWECVGLTTWLVGEGSSKGVVVVVQQHVVHQMQFELTHKCIIWCRGWSSTRN
jgi:hypothetical protein